MVVVLSRCVGFVPLAPLGLAWFWVSIFPASAGHWMPNESTDQANAIAGTLEHGLPASTPQAVLGYNGTTSVRVTRSPRTSTQSTPFSRFIVPLANIDCFEINTIWLSPTHYEIQKRLNGYRKPS